MLEIFYVTSIEFFLASSSPSELASRLNETKVSGKKPERILRPVKLSKTDDGHGILETRVPPGILTCKPKVTVASSARRVASPRRDIPAVLFSPAVQSGRWQRAPGARVPWYWVKASRASTAPRSRGLWVPWSRSPVASDRCNRAARVRVEVQRLDAPAKQTKANVVSAIEKSPPSGE